MEEEEFAEVEETETSAIGDLVEGNGDVGAVSSTAAGTAGVVLTVAEVLLSSMVGRSA